MKHTLSSVMQEVRALVQEYRARCLWYLRDDYQPQNALEAGRVLDAIERHGDLRAFQRAAPLRQWLSQNTSATSAG